MHIGAHPLTGKVQGGAPAPHEGIDGAAERGSEPDGALTVAEARVEVEAEVETEVEAEVEEVEDTADIMFTNMSD